MRVFLVEPYFTGSHRAWAEGYEAASRHDVRLITHEGRFWKWRMQGGAATLAHQVTAAAEEGSPDVVLASSMTNLPALLGLARRAVSDAVVALYMHENQLTYPLSPTDQPDASYAMLNWLSMTAADLVIFNSEFHRAAWFEALPTFLGQFPDYRHGTGHVAAVAERTTVLPVGVDLRRLDGPDLRAEPPLVLWNQRCEYDKGPGAFVEALLETADRGIPFRVALAGERFVSEPEEFGRLRAALAERIVHDGYAQDRDYPGLLRAADVVVSTARQEFFGVAVTEAIYAGAFPLLPHRLVYPERIPSDVHDRCLYADHDDLVNKLAWVLRDPDARRETSTRLGAVMADLDWTRVAPRYDDRLAELVGDSAR